MSATEYFKNYYLSNKEKFKEGSAKYYMAKSAELKLKSLEYAHLKRYGITRNEAFKLKDKQENRCTICTDFAKLELDHCHKTKKIRGFLCSKCNKALGLLKDSTENLERVSDFVFES